MYKMSVMDGQTKGIAGLLTLKYLDMMDVRKFNPSRGNQVALSGEKSANNFVLEKTFHFSLSVPKTLQFPAVLC